MTDFALTADAPTAAHATPSSLENSGLAPTAEVAPAKPSKAKDRPLYYAPCPLCGETVLTGFTDSGERLVVDDVHAPTYVVVWVDVDKPPLLKQSRGVPVHRCRG